jgi:hypothetical protein
MRVTLSEKHVYSTDGGRVLPSVTQIVNEVTPRKHLADEWFLHRGSMVHRAVALALRGVLDRESLDPVIAPRVDAAERCVQEMGWCLRDAAIEVSLGSPLGFAGTPDLILSDGTVIDWKSSEEPQVEVQLGGYAVLGGGGAFCFGVVLNEDGTYRVAKYQSRRCRGLFLNYLSVWQFKKQAGL